MATYAPSGEEKNIQYVIRRFQTKKVRYAWLKKRILRLFVYEFRMLYATYNNGIKATKARNGKPSAGQEKVSNNPDNKESSK